MAENCKICKICDNKTEEEINNNINDFLNEHIKLFNEAINDNKKMIIKLIRQVLSNANDREEKIFSKFDEIIYRLEKIEYKLNNK